MRRMIGVSALAAVLVLVLVVPAMAQGGGDGGQVGAQSQERVAERHRAVAGVAEQAGDQVRSAAQLRIQARDEDCDGTGSGVCPGGQLRSRVGDTDRVRDATTAGVCSGDQLRARLRDRERDCTVCDLDGVRLQRAVGISWVVEWRHADLIRRS